MYLIRDGGHFRCPGSLPPDTSQSIPPKGDPLSDLSTTIDKGGFGFVFYQLL